jgi:hypothetical protein
MHLCLLGYELPPPSHLRPDVTLGSAFYYRLRSINLHRVTSDESPTGSLKSIRIDSLKVTRIFIQMKNFARLISG